MSVDSTQGPRFSNAQNLTMASDPLQGLSERDRCVAEIVQKNSPLESLIDGFSKDKPSVCAFLIISRGDFKKVNESLQKDPQVLKTAAVSRAILGKAIEQEVEDCLKSLEGGQEFLAKLHGVTSGAVFLFDETVWDQEKAAAILRLKPFFDEFKDDEDVILSTLGLFEVFQSYKREDLNAFFEYFKELNSDIFNNPDFVRRALQQVPRVIERFVQKDLLESVKQGLRL